MFNDEINNVMRKNVMDATISTSEYPNLANIIPHIISWFKDCLAV